MLCIYRDRAVLRDLVVQYQARTKCEVERRRKKTQAARTKETRMFSGCAMAVCARDLRCINLVLVRARSHLHTCTPHCAAIAAAAAAEKE